MKKYYLEKLGKNLGIDREFHSINMVDTMVYWCRIVGQRKVLFVSLSAAIVGSIGAAFSGKERSYRARIFLPCVTSPSKKCSVRSNQVLFFFLTANCPSVKKFRVVSTPSSAAFGAAFSGKERSYLCHEIQCPKFYIRLEPRTGIALPLVAFLN